MSRSSRALCMSAAGPWCGARHRTFERVLFRCVANPSVPSWFGRPVPGVWTRSLENLGLGRQGKSGVDYPEAAKCGEGCGLFQVTK